MGSTFDRARQLRLPRWLGGFESGSYGQRYQGSIGGMQEAEVARLRAAAKFRFASTVPDDGLVQAGNDRLLERVPNGISGNVVESFNAFRVRLQHAPGANYWIGTREGIRAIFYPYGFSGASFDNSVIALHDYEIDFAGFDPEFFARVWVVLLAMSIFVTDGTWGDPGTWGDGGTWGSNISVADVGYMRRQILARKSPGAYPVTVAATLEGDLWGIPAGVVWEPVGDVWGGKVVYITIGHVWGEEAWLGGTEVWGSPPGEIPWRGYELGTV